MKSIITTIVLLVFHSIIYGQQLQATRVEPIVPFERKTVVLSPSRIQQREMLNIQYLKSLDPDRLLHNFRINVKLPSTARPLDGWESPNIGLRGHFTGHYLSAIASVVERYGDSLLSTRLQYMVDELYRCQMVSNNGYLSAFPETEFDILESRFGGVWAPYYTYHKIMQGLLDAHLRTRNQRAYEMVLHMADYVEKRMARLSDETINKVLYSVGANPANEAGAMNEVLYRLYNVSKNPRHLALARIFDRDWFAVPLSKNQDILSGLHSNTHLVLVNGFAQRYNITKEKKYHDAVTNFWNMLMKSHAYANGSSSGPRPNVTAPTSLSAEHWGIPGHLAGTMTRETSESCVSHNTQKLSSTLFTWTGSPVLAEAYMNTFYNSTLALQSGKSGRCVYHLPLGSPRKKEFLKEDDFRCCNGTTIEAFASLNEGIYYHDNANVWVNLYIPSSFTWEEKGMTLKQAGNFPEDGNVAFTVLTDKSTSLTLNFLAPSWAKKVDVYINGTKQALKVLPGSYISLRREWKKNDKVRLNFHYDFCISAMPDDSNVIAVFYGPTLLAFQDDSELILKGTPAEILKHLSKDHDGKRFRLVNNGKTYLLRPLYDVEDESYGVYATIRNY
ncbi:glycoside hydrolase family 127 protein [Chitinophaga sedimenti]|uniref:beta-L-arabinofuranosidase domain-containing protein n=1 Tax=Chitinophaga sedimenti TaxID=2033606 RepID=UPI002002C1F1|nr:beta-L-arabinofuranosidase domain-containing protein [Chitinophaga sedimenti]MCK7560035.1 glycoside hydrolase family 127 protein [Chitinophaga sedimenti]